MLATTHAAVWARTVAINGPVACGVPIRPKAHATSAPPLRPTDRFVGIESPGSGDAAATIVRITTIEGSGTLMAREYRFLVALKRKTA